MNELICKKRIIYDVKTVIFTPPNIEISQGNNYPFDLTITDEKISGGPISISADKVKEVNTISFTEGIVEITLNKE